MSEIIETESAHLWSTNNYDPFVNIKALSNAAMGTFKTDVTMFRISNPAQFKKATLTIIVLAPLMT